MVANVALPVFLLWHANDCVVIVNHAGPWLIHGFFAAVTQNGTFSFCEDERLKVFCTVPLLTAYNNNS